MTPMGRVWPLLLLGACFWVTEAEKSARWDLDGDGVARPDDCDDASAEVGSETWYVDADGDTFGDSATAMTGCELGEGFSQQAGDCDDGDPLVFPDAEERCNGADDDCDGVADNDAPTGTWWMDSDGDSYGDPAAPVSACEQPPGTVGNDLDCDDGTELVSPDAQEICNNIDDDCDQLIDFEDPDLDSAEHTWFVDVDLDGWGIEDNPIEDCEQPDGTSSESGDCDDTNPYIHPGLKQDDCATEGVDDNCDGATDPPDSLNAILSWPDQDGDGFGDPVNPFWGCVLLPEYVLNGLDCDDTDPCTHLGATEVCDGGIDNNCLNDGDVGCITVATDTSDTGANQCP